MRLKTIREQLLFIADYHRERIRYYEMTASQSSERPKSVGAGHRKSAMMHRRFSTAADAALDLL